MPHSIFSDEKLTEEFLDRFNELSAGDSANDGGNLESLESIPESPYSVDDARSAVTSMQEGRHTDVAPGLEAIILRFGRPAYFVQNETFDTDGTPSSSAEVDGVVNTAKNHIDLAIPKVGRINLRNHRNPWAGTGWVIAPNVVVTNQHVANVFAQRDGDSFVFIESAGRKARAELDTRREHQVSTEEVYQLKDVLWIAPPSGSHDVAFLSIEPKSLDDHVQPSPIELIDQQGFDDFPVDNWAAVIGYPAFSIFNDSQDQQRIFEGVFDVKRMQPGKITAKGNDGIVKHDATTLGGNSGSVVLDLESGKAIALHFGGIEGESNSAVAAPIVQELFDTHVS